MSDSPSPANPPTQPPSPPPWWRRKAVFIPALVVTGLLGGGVFLGPAVAGSVAASRIRSVLERELQSDVAVGSVSLSWAGRARVTELTIRPRGAGFTGPLLSIPVLEASFSLRSALRGEYRAEVDLLRPVLRIERGAEGKFNYEFPEPPEEVRRRRRRRAGEPPPYVRATIRIRDGRLLIGRGERGVEYSAISLDAWIESLEQPVGFSLSMADSSGGRLSARGEYDAAAGAGTMRALAEEVSLEGLGEGLAVWAPGISLGGVARGAFECRWRGGPGFEGRGQVEVRSFVLERRGGKMAVDRLVFLYEGSREGDGPGRQSVTLAAGRALVGSLTAKLGESSRTALKVELESDLSELSKSLRGAWAAPALEGIARVRGSFERGGDRREEGRWNVEAEGEGVAAEGARLGSVRVESAGTLEASGRPVGSASLRLGEGVWARVELAAEAQPGGASRRMSFEAQGDLAELSRILDRVAGARPGVRLEGKAALQGRGVLRESGESTGDLVLTAEKVRAVDAEGRRGEAEPALGVKLAWGWEAASGRLRIPSLEAVTAWGRLEGSIETLREEGRWRPTRFFAKLGADLERAKTRLAWGAGDLPALGGRVEGALRFEEGRFELDGAARGLIVSRGAAPAEASLALAGRMEFPAEGWRVGVESGALAWSRPGESVRGSLAGRFSYAQGTAAGVLSVRDLEIGDGRKVFAREPRVDGECDVGFGPGGAEIRKLELVSRALSVSSAGRAGGPRGWDLRARVRYVPEALGAALGPWAAVRLEGTKEREAVAHLEAPAGAGELWGFLRRARGEARIDLAPLTASGVTVSGRVRAELREGRLSVVAPLSVNEGTAQVSGVFDLREKEAGPKSALSIQVREVRANAQMGPFLEKISPIFHTVDGTVEGKVEGEAVLEWGVSAEQGVQAALGALGGKGVFAVRELVVTGSPAAAQLLGALGEESAVRGELRAADVRVGSGRCSYEGMTLRLARYELRFTGWVGFDGAMELLVEMPLTERFLRRHPRLGGMSGKTFFVALEGTVARPRLDLDRAVQELLRRVVEGAAQEKLEDAIRRLLERRGKNR